MWDFLFEWRVDRSAIPSCNRRAWLPLMSWRLEVTNREEQYRAAPSLAPNSDATIVPAPNDRP